MLGAYLNQTAEWSPALREPDGSAVTDNRGEVLHEVPQSIHCRRRATTKQVLSADEQLIQCLYVYYISHAVREDDMLDGRRVMSASEWTGLSGEILGYKAAV